MIDRQKLETILARRFPGATASQVATASNAIMGLGDEWVEIVGDVPAFDPHCAPECRDVCYLAQEFSRGADLRVFRRRDSS